MFQPWLNRFLLLSPAFVFQVLQRSTGWRSASAARWEVQGFFLPKISWIWCFSILLIISISLLLWKNLVGKFQLDWVLWARNVSLLGLWTAQSKSVTTWRKTIALDDKKAPRRRTGPLCWSATPSLLRKPNARRIGSWPNCQWSSQLWQWHMAWCELRANDRSALRCCLEAPRCRGVLAPRGLLRPSSKLHTAWLQVSGTMRTLCSPSKLSGMKLTMMVIVVANFLPWSPCPCPQQPRCCAKQHVVMASCSSGRCHRFWGFLREKFKITTILKRLVASEVEHWFMGMIFTA